MNRLTEKCWRNLDPWECCGQDKNCTKGCHEEGGCTKGCKVPKLYISLAKYEDAEEDGLLIKLPFGIGTPIYKVCYAPQINDGYIYETTMSLKFYADNISAFEEGMVYSDKTEAEQVLQRMKEKTVMESNIKQVANMLGVELLEEFKVKLTEKGKSLGYKENNTIYRFDTELASKGFDDGWSEWYGGNAKMLESLLLGIYEISKEET